jgi:hypothetical protein
MSSTLDSISKDGYLILEETNSPRAACDKQNSWIENVTSYIEKHYPNMGLVAEWKSLGKATVDSQYPLKFNWQNFNLIINNRLVWLSNLPSKASYKSIINTPIGLGVNQSPIWSKSNKTLHLDDFISTERINELKSINNSKFELKKLLTLCNELNICHREGCWYAVIALTRILLDYVPPLFQKDNFASVAAQCAKKSIKPVLEKLQVVTKNIADSHLHEQAKKAESILTTQQVSFRNELDVLLSEVYLTLKTN